ncbi:hypothetical protein KI387_022034, partial [Taxus chinensis]
LYRGEIFNWVKLLSARLHEFLSLSCKGFYMTEYAIGLFLEAMFLHATVGKTFAGDNSYDPTWPLVFHWKNLGISLEEHNERRVAAKKRKVTTEQLVSEEEEDESRTDNEDEEEGHIEELYFSNYSELLSYKHIGDAGKDDGVQTKMSSN